MIKDLGMIEDLGILLTSFHGYCKMILDLVSESSKGGN